MSEHDEEALPERETFIRIKDGEIAEGQVLADLDGAGEIPPQSDDEEELEHIPEQEDALEEEFMDDSMHTFEGHSAGVYAVAWSPVQNDLVATGGGDDIAFLWRVGEDAFAENQGAVHELSGHTDTISGLAFSADGSMLASAGMDGTVRLWNPVDGTSIQALEGPGDAIEWVAWHPKGNVVLAGSADFTVWMWLAQTGTCMQVFSGHAGPVTCGKFTPDGKLVITGGGEGDASLRIWEPRTGECKMVVQGGKFHAEGLTSLAVNPDSTIVLTGSEDGTAKVISIEGGRVVASLEGHDEGFSVEAVAFLPGLPLALTAGLDGKLVIWDLGTFTPRATCQHPEGITRIVCHPWAPFVVTGCIDGSVRCWDARTGACTQTWHGHREAVQDLALSSDGKMILSGSEDGSARVFLNDGPM